MKSLIVIVLDESGSMADKKSDILGGFNEFLKEQKELTDDVASAIFLKFNSEVTIVNECKPIAEVAELTKDTFKPGGSTALYDAIFDGVTLGEKVESDVDRVLCLIMTDGEENASRKIHAKGIRDLIKRKEDEGKWTFLYIGENPERWANDTGTSSGNVAQYDHAAPRENFERQREAVRRYRRDGAIRQERLLEPEPESNASAAPTVQIQSAATVPNDPPPPYSAI